MDSQVVIEATPALEDQRLAHEVQTYEQCVDCMMTLSESLRVSCQSLKGMVETVKESNQLTSMWLQVWKQVGC